jgi:hypothetical protein
LLGTHVCDALPFGAADLAIGTVSADPITAIRTADFAATRWCAAPGVHLSCHLCRLRNVYDFSHFCHIQKLHYVGMVREFKEEIEKIFAGAVNPPVESRIRWHVRELDVLYISFWSTSYWLSRPKVYTRASGFSIKVR